MTFQGKLFLGFCLMLLPVLLLGGEALRSNRQERRALEELGESIARTRTYAELETAMFDQSVEIWALLSGLDPDAEQDFLRADSVITYWQGRWRAELQPDELDLAGDVEKIHAHIQSLAERIFLRLKAGDREAAYRLAERELKGELLPALTRKNREIYGEARERGVRRTYARVEEILAEERRVLLAIVALSPVVGLAASLVISRSLARPIRKLRAAMAEVGAGHLSQPIDIRSGDEIGDLARAFGRMTANLERSYADMERLNEELARKVIKLEETQAQLVHSEKLAAIGEMSAAVAHGLRNPLSSLRAAAQVALRRMPGDAAAREHVEAIVGEVDRLDTRISHLLSFSRPPSSHRRRVPPAQLVEGAIPSIAGRLADGAVELAIDVPAGLPEVEVDPLQLEQAVVEILSNALDAMPTGGRLAIRAHREPEGESGDVVLEISDTGEGIAAEVVASVFEPFFTTRAEGTGLGLAIARRYVVQSGGRLEIRSARGEGTTARILLRPAPRASGKA